MAERESAVRHTRKFRQIPEVLILQCTTIYLFRSLPVREYMFPKILLGVMWGL